MGVALSPPDGPASKQHRLINHIANEKKNKQTTGVPGVVSEFKEQSFSVKKVIECAGLIVCVSLSRWKHKHTKRKWLTPKKKKKEKRISCVLNWEKEVAKKWRGFQSFLLSYFPEAAGKISFDSFTRIKSLSFSLVSGAGVKNQLNLGRLTLLDELTSAIECCKCCWLLLLLPDDDLDWADSGVVMSTIRYRGRRHRRRSCLVLVFGTQRHVDKFARHHGHSVLHQVENVLAVIEETDQMEGAERITWKERITIKLKKQIQYFLIHWFSIGLLLLLYL